MFDAKHVADHYLLREDNNRLKNSFFVCGAGALEEIPRHLLPGPQRETLFNQLRRVLTWPALTRHRGSEPCCQVRRLRSAPDLTCR